MRPNLRRSHPKLQPGSRVAVLSPSFAAPALFPHVHELALRRLREELHLEPVEFPTTRQLPSPPSSRAADINAAFADPSIAAIFATLGGDDQLTVLPHLDRATIAQNPKPFVGYSDNTNLLNFLWNLGIPSYHGGSTMVHLARPGGLHPLSTASLRAALWTKADVELRPVDAFNEDELDWGDAGFLAPESLSPSPVQCCTEGWFWHNHEGKVVTAPAWGGNLEVLHWNLAASRWIRADVGDYAGCVLLLETSEEMPTATEVYRMLRNAGERGLLAQFPAVLVARPKASSRDVVRTADERVVYRREQRDAMLKAFKTYAPGAMVVFNLDFGHTDPQYILPYGGEITVDGIEKKVIAHFG